MMGTKTRIWRGGMSEILHTGSQPDTEATAQPEPTRTPAPAAPPESSTNLSRLPALHTDGLAARKTRVGSGTLVGHVFDLSALAEGPPAQAPARRPSLMATTRLVPIEELLVERERGKLSGGETKLPTPQAPVQTSDDLDSGQTITLPMQGLTGTHLRRGLMVVLGLAAVVVFAIGPREDAALAALPEPVVAQPATRSAALPRQQTTDAVPQPEHLRTAAPSGRQRAAVDALVAGDFVGARRIYSELAQAHDAGDPKVFAEAARILEERIRGRSN